MNDDLINDKKRSGRRRHQMAVRPRCTSTGEKSTSSCAPDYRVDEICSRRTYGLTAVVGRVPGDQASSPRASSVVAGWKTIGIGQEAAAVGEAPRYHIPPESVVAAIRPSIAMRPVMSAQRDHSRKCAILLHLTDRRDALSVLSAED